MHYLPILTESMLETKPRLASEAIRSRYEAGPKYEGLNEVGGELSSEVHPILIGMALKAWCGQASGSIGTSEYTHTFLPLQSDFDSKAASPLAQGRGLKLSWGIRTYLMGGRPSRRGVD